MQKVVIGLLFSLLFLVLLFFNLGNFLDATSKPQKTDLLVCLGGGDHERRLEKTFELYQKAYVSSDTIIFTGHVKSLNAICSGVFKKFLDTHKELPKMLFNTDVKNTAQEMLFVKSYMLTHHIKDVTIVTDSPHSRRVVLFFKLFNIDGDTNLNIRVVGSTLPYWNKEQYYQNKHGLKYAKMEVLKLFYGIFYHLVWEDWIQNLPTMQVYRDDVLRFDLKNSKS